MIYAMKPCFQNGKPMKRVIVYFEAKDKDEAFKAFGVGHFWGGYSENTAFTAEEVDSVPKNGRFCIAADVIEENKETNF
tara:strand:+ start:268 stop:504 length:237 start_codon:yes stop_codon:yes gene_type:complete